MGGLGLTDHLLNCAGMFCLTSSPPRWTHSHSLSHELWCFLLSSPLLIDICHHFCCPCFLSLSLLPLSLPLLHNSQVSHKAACLWSHCLLLRLHLGAGKPPFPQHWSFPHQGHWPVLAIFIPNFSVDRFCT